MTNKYANRVPMKKSSTEELVISLNLSRLIFLLLVLVPTPVQLESGQQGHPLFYLFNFFQFLTPLTTWVNLKDNHPKYQLRKNVNAIFFLKEKLQF